MVGQCLLLALFFQKFIIFGGKSARCRVKKWSDWNFFPPFLTFYRFTRTAQWYFVKGVDLKVPHTKLLAYFLHPCRVRYIGFVKSCGQKFKDTDQSLKFTLRFDMMLPKKSKDTDLISE